MTTEPPSEYELSMAMTWTVINACRLFHGLGLDDITEAEQRFLEKWRAIPVERRQAALDWVEPLPPQPSLEEERQARIRAMRDVLEGRVRGVGS